MIFPDSHLVNITMIGMLSSLDVFWINSEGYVLKILENIPVPQKNDPYTKIHGAECKYLLEIFSKNNICKFLRVDDKIDTSLWQKF